MDDLSDLDVERLRNAFEGAMRLSDDRGYQHWAGIQSRHGQHGNLHFLPWNRVYLLQFERTLQNFEPGVSLPWWDWGASKAHGEGIPEVFAAATVEERPNPLYVAEIETGDAHAPPQTSREPALPIHLPGEEVITEVLEVSDFEEFSLRLETLHNAIHGWVGGTNGFVAFASYDPFYWAYQASVDRIWWIWQQMHPEQGAPPSIAAEPLAPFKMTTQEAWDATLLGYEYALSTSRSRSFPAGAANDRPASTDELNFSDYAQAFAEIIASKNTTPPLTIGIYGQWGIGKSSLLQMIAEEFENPRRENQEAAKVHVVDFNAWKYSANEKIWPALVREIMQEMESAAQWTFRTRFADTLKRNTRRNWRQHRGKVIGALAVAVPLAALAAWQLNFSPALILAALAVIGIPGVVKLVADTITNPISRWVSELVEQGQYGDELPYMREIHDDLEFLTQQLHRKPQGEKTESTEAAPRVLVMIDDLDRCDPEKAVEVLQAINLLLNFDVFVVCLGIDARVISAAVEAHYNELLGPAGATGYEYLEKIVQIPFRIPLASPLEIARFLDSQMPERPRNSDEGERSATSEDREIDPTARYESESAKAPPKSNASGASASPAKGPVVDDAMFDRHEVRSFQELAPFIRRNPRHIKRLVNVYRMVRTLAVRRGAEEILEKPKVTAAWIIVCAQWPYTVRTMLESFDRLVERVEAGEEEYPDTEPLVELHREAKPHISPELQRKIDDDPAGLEKLIDAVTITWSELSRVQPYTLNFNPAIEEALHHSAPDRPPTADG